MPTTIFFHTIGCRLNQYETAVLRNTMVADGYFPLEKPDRADIVVINTCTVTENSDTDTRKYINRLIRINPRVAIALVGCQAQIQGKELSGLPHVRWIIGNQEKFHISKIISRSGRRTTSPIVRTPQLTSTRPFRQRIHGIDPTHTRANLKIQDGCNHFCSYCEVPYARGLPRSRDYNDILEEAQALTNAGHKEIVLTGINIGLYAFKGKTLIDVIRGLETISKLKRIRISSIEPSASVSDVIDEMTRSKKLCRYLHMPLQYGHDDILKKMRRKYRVKDCASLFQKAKDIIPEITIGTDIIVGFPGETHEHFEEAYRVFTALPVDYFHVFGFSVRRMAKAKDFPDQVSKAKIQERSRRLRQLSQRKRSASYTRYLNKVMPVLFEQKKSGYWHGVTDNFIHVSVPADASKNLKNSIRQVRLKKVNGQIVLGKLVSP